MKSFEESMKEIEMIFREEAENEKDADVAYIMEEAAAAIKHYIPTPVKNLRCFEDKESGNCPECDTFLTRTLHHDAAPTWFCYSCGQALHWA